MKKLLLITAFTALSSLTFANDEALSSELEFRVIDVNQDSQISIEEAVLFETLSASFISVDIDGNGYISEAEFKVLDTDANGLVSADELSMIT
ncbi:hypothetical protein, partial [Reinekea sp.]